MNRTLCDKSRALYFYFYLCFTIQLRHNSIHAFDKVMTVYTLYIWVRTVFFLVPLLRVWMLSYSDMAKRGPAVQVLLHAIIFVAIFYKKACLNFNQFYQALINCNYLLLLYMITQKKCFPKRIDSRFLKRKLMAYCIHPTCDELFVW